MRFNRTVRTWFKRNQDLQTVATTVERHIALRSFDLAQNSTRRTILNTRIVNIPWYSIIDLTKTEKKNKPQLSLRRPKSATTYHIYIAFERLSRQECHFKSTTHSGWVEILPMAAWPVMRRSPQMSSPPVNSSSSPVEK